MSRNESMFSTQTDYDHNFEKRSNINMLEQNFYHTLNCGQVSFYLLYFDYVNVNI